MSNLHAHMSIYSSDCDGSYDRAYTLRMTDEEVASDFGDIEFHNRVVGGIVNTYCLMKGTEGRLVVDSMEDGSVRAVWREQTEEGGIESEAVFCEEDCEDVGYSYRDHRAEEMGY